jgi:hypothetical protein
MMNIEARTELMAVLTEISRIAPYYRLGQLVSLLSEMADTPYRYVVPEIEDEELLPVAREFLETMRRLPASSHDEQIRGHLEGDRLLRQAAG